MQELLKGTYSGNILNIAAEDGLVCCHTSYNSSNFNNKRHYHQNAHISFVIEGACAEKRSSDYERLPGHVTFYQAGEPHQVTGVASLSRHVNIEIESTFFERFSITEQQLESAVKQMPDIKFIMIKMYKELLYNDQFSSLSLQSLLLNIVTSKERLSGTGTIPSWAVFVKDYLQANWNEPITLSQLAVLSGVHPITISKYFSRYFGCNLGAYRRKLKIEHSLSMIKSSDISLTDTAFKCGFADQSHFIRTFKEMTGLIPTFYKSL